MAKVICTLPHASDVINGVKFVEHKLGMISEEIEEDVAALFLSIEGYIAPGKKGAPAKDQDEAPKAADAPPAGNQETPPAA